MITVKALVAITLTAMGGATAGSVAYMQSSPPAPIPMLPEPAPNGARAEPVPLVMPETNPPRIALKKVPPVVRRKAPVAAPEPAEASVPCSTWRDLESGPEGRQVRMLCAPAR